MVVDIFVVENVDPRLGPPVAGGDRIEPVAPQGASSGLDVAALVAQGREDVGDFALRVDGESEHEGFGKVLGL